MQNTPAIEVLINDVINIAAKEGDFDIPSTPDNMTEPKEYAGFKGFVKASAEKIQNRINATHEYVTEYKKKQNEFDIKQKKDTFKAEVKTVLEKIDKGQKITNGAEIKIYRMICQSKSLAKIEKENIKKIIKNIPPKLKPFQALVENTELGKHLEYYPQIKCKILQSTLKQDEKAHILESFNKNRTRIEAQSYQDPDILKIEMLKYAMSLAEGVEDNKYLPLFELWKQDKAENGGIKTAWSCCYDLDLKNTRSKIQDVIHTQFNVNSETAIADQVPDEFAEDIKTFLEDLKGFSYALQVIDHKSGGSIDNKMAAAIEYCSIYPEILENKEKQLERRYDIAYKKYEKEYHATIQKRNEARKKYNIYKAEHDRKKQLGQEVNEALLGKYKSDLDSLEAQIEAHLPEKYHRSEFTKQAVKTASHLVAGVVVGAVSYVAGPAVGGVARAAAKAGVEMVASTVLQKTIENITSDLSGRIEQWQKAKSLKNNVSQAMDNDDLSSTTASFNGMAQNPDPQKPTKLSDAERNSEIAKIETPFERIASVFEGIDAENLKTVNNKVLSALFDITLNLAIDEGISLDKRFGPIIKLMETIPQEKFKFDNQSILEDGNTNEANNLNKNKIYKKYNEKIKEALLNKTLNAETERTLLNELHQNLKGNSTSLNPDVDEDTLMNPKKIFLVTDLIKTTLELNRGDYASSLIKSFFKKLATVQPDALATTNNLGAEIREAISEITEKSLLLSNKHYSEHATDQKAPIASLLNLLGERTILERNGIGQQKDIPIIGYLPELVATALKDLNNGKTPTTQHLLKLATEEFAVRTPEVIVQGTQIFNGEDKLFLAEMIDKAEVISQSNHWSKKRMGALIDPNPLDKMLAKFLDQYQAGHFAQGGGFSDKEEEEPYEILPKLVALAETQQTETNNTATYLHHLQDRPFKQIYDACDTAQDRVQAMQERFNAVTPIRFKKTITPNMSKQRVARDSYTSHTGVPGSIGGVGN